MNYDLFCDESRQDLLACASSITEVNRFCCIGGLSVPTEKRVELKKQINALKVHHGVLGEIKWGTVSDSRLQFYLDLVDLFFSTDDLCSRVVVIDASKIRNNVFNDNDQELGYYKFYYQLLYHWVSWENSYRVYTDQKTNRDKKRLQELRRIVNFQFPISDPILSIQAIDSKESEILQLQNVIMGAIGYKYNFKNAGKSSAKKAVVERIEQHLHHSIGRTSAAVQKFNVFEIDLRGAD